jgi:hypothetical protein
VLAMCVVCGCVGTRGYFTDRRRDALDTVTLTTGVGLGVKARVGPLAAGLFGNQDLAGLRCGEFFSAGVHEDLCGESEESLGMPIVAALELFGECMDVRVLDGDLGAWSGFDAELIVEQSGRPVSEWGPSGLTHRHPSARLAISHGGYHACLATKTTARR